MNRTVLLWLVVGWIGVLILPWYVIEDGFWGLEWVLDGYPFDTDYGPTWAHLLEGEKVWLAPIPLFLLLPFLTGGRIKSDPLYSKILIVSGLGGLSYIVIQGFIVGIAGWEYTSLELLFGPLGQKQYGLGYGAILVSAAFLFFTTQGIAARGAVNGDVFVVSSIGFIVAIVGAFIFFPVSQILISALQDNEGVYSLGVFLEKFTDKKIWGLDCLYSTVGCGAAWNSLFLAITVGATTTALGLVFALVATRSGFKYRKVLRALTILPIITPPFVIGLSIILLFGLSGIMTQFFGDVFGIQPTRWVYGLPGIWIAQMLAYTPIAFLVMIGVVEGISPSMEEAAQTLRADRWKTFTTVSLPLMRPGLANAFLIGFIESMADFGNPLVLGGNFDVLSTEIFFAIVGAQNDQGMAAVLAFVLLCFTLTAFYAQRRWLGKKSYTTVTGKGDGGTHALLPNRLRWPIYTVAFSWTGFTIVVYCMILFGGFVNTWGLDHTFTFKHYITAFSVNWTDGGLQWTGAAWDSFWTTISIATISAPLTAAVGLLTAYILVRQTFTGKDLFEFGTMLSFAIPGTVIGVSYILAFNVPPIELTGTGAILVLCFVFRNMPVGVRAGVAAMSQLDKSLDEASLTLGANSWYTFRKIVLPLLRPAIIAALVYSFVRAMTAISAVIFLVSAEYDMATSYIIGRVENNDYGLAIAYCTVLIFVMLAAVLVFQGLVGERKMGRREPEKTITPASAKAI
ncbi:MAG: iron ABC transporter permease [Rhodospirillales bacterium]|nr:iron ABC transporter permease [Rhodospirillales bacterium]